MKGSCNNISNYSVELNKGVESNCHCPSDIAQYNQNIKRPGTRPFEFATRNLLRNS